MNKENTIKLWEKYPIIFSGRYLSLQESLIPFGFECGDGWYDLIHDLCEEITTLIGDKDITVTAEQVKEKFGGLRFYYSIRSPETFMSIIDSVISHFMFKRKWGVYYWKIVDFRKKFYRTAVEKISDAVDHAEHKSYDTCEYCGEPGKTRGKGWVSTQCDKCWKSSKLNREG
jgi:hypothetical protein